MSGILNNIIKYKKVELKCIQLHQCQDSSNLFMQTRVTMYAKSRNICSASYYIAFDKREPVIYPFFPILVQRSVRIHDEKKY